ncbi:MAG: CARDB domain-containing protein [Verrucomicrobiaceae bacterium]
MKSVIGQLIMRVGAKCYEVRDTQTTFRLRLCSGFRLSLVFAALLCFCQNGLAAISVGGRVSVTQNGVNIRAGAGSTIVNGQQNSGALGTVTGGPTNAQIGGTGTTYTWWNVNFDSGADGWVASIYLAEVAAPTMSLSSPNAGATWQTGTSQTVSWSVSGDTVPISYFVVRLSTNNGSSYTDISSNLSASARSFNYTPSSGQATTTAVCWVRAFNSGGTVLAGAISSGAFAIATPPSATTNAATNITTTSAQMNGTINPNGASTTAYFQYGATTSYGSSSGVGSFGSGTSSIAINTVLSGASPNTTFHYRVVATNSGGTTYGSDRSFTTDAPQPPPSATTNAATNVTANSGQLNATINPNGSSTTAYFEYGPTTSYGGTGGSTNCGSGTSAVNLFWNNTGLNFNTTFHYRVVATNSGGTTYGGDVTFTTLPAPVPPTILAPGLASSPGPTLGTLTPIFNWNAVSGATGYGLYIRDMTTDTLIYNNDGGVKSGTSFTLPSGYLSNNGHAYRWAMTSFAGGYESAQGSYLYFKAPPAAPLPSAQTLAATNVTANSAQLNATINPNGSSTTAYFQYGPTTSYGGTGGSTTCGSGTSAVNLFWNNTGLNFNTTFHYRVVATNSGGTTYGDDVTFTTLPPAAPPTVQTGSASSITTSTAVINGAVLSDGGSSIIDRRFDWGTFTPLNQAVLSGAITVSGSNFSATLTGLAPNTTYFFRAWARNGSTSDVGYGAGWNIGSILSFTTSSGVQPNLALYQPSGWSDKIVVSKVTGNHSDSSSFATTDSIYLDWAVINSGAGATNSRFYTELYVDGTLRTTWSTEPSLAASSYDSRNDYAIGTLSAGTHDILIKTDSTSAVSESNESDNQYTKSITVGTTQDPPITGLSVTGRVLSRTSGLVLAGVTVTLAGKSATTATNGTFSLANVDLAVGSNLVVSLAGYLQHAQTVSAASNVRSVNVSDISLSPSSTTKPVVESVTPIPVGVYLYGIGYQLAVEARVNWNGNQPGNVQFFANGHLVNTLTVSGPTYTILLNADSEFVPAWRLSANTIRVVALSGAGVASDASDKSVAVIPLGGLVSIFKDLVEVDPEKAWLDFEFPIQKQDLLLPVIGKLGWEIRLGASFDYTFADGSFELGVGVTNETKQGKRGRRPLIPGFTRYEKPKFYVGNREIESSFYVVAEGTATITDGIKLSQIQGDFDIAAKLELTRYGVPGTIVAAFSAYPAAQQVLNNFSAIIYAKPEVEGELVFEPVWPIVFREGEFEGKLGLEAAYEPEISGVLKGRVYIGSEGSFKLGSREPIFREARVKIYGGFEMDAWFLTIGREWVVLDYGYPAAPASPAVASDLIMKESGTEQMTWAPMARRWRDAGGETFLLAPAGTAFASPASGEQTAPLDIFRRMGNARPPGASYEPKAEKGGVGAQLIGSDPGLPTQTALPLLANVFPNSTPALAGRGSELMLLYVRDSGAANPVHFTELAFTYFDGTTWSPPAAVAADPRGQFAPRIVFDGVGRLVAVWEQMKDAAFTGTDLAAAAAQMEIMTAAWSPVTRAWSASAALTNNAFLDHSAHLSGPLTDGDLILTWIQNEGNLLTGAGVQGDATNSRVMTMRWDSATATWGAAGTLVANLTSELSDSLAASGNKAVYLWSKDGDGILDDLADAELYYRIYNASTGLWGSETRYTNDAIADKNAKVVLDATGGVYAVWQRGSDLVMDRDFAGTPTAVRPDSTTMGFADFALTIGPGGNVLAIWQEMSDAGSDAHYRVFDPASNTWGLDTLLSNDAALERSFAPVWDTVGNLVLAYNNVELTKQTKTVAVEGGGTIDIPGVPQPGQVDLFAARRALVTDLGFGINGLTAVGATFLPGDAVTLKAKVRNTGNIAVQNVQVAFYDGDPAAGGTLIQTVTISGWLKSSDEQEVSVAWTIPAPAAAHTVFAVIDPAAQVTEFNETDNSSALALNGADLQVDYISGSVLRDGSVRVVVQVRNGGAPASAVTNLKLWPKLAPGANPLATVQVSSLSPGDSVEIPMDLPAGSQAEGDVAYRLTVDEDNLSGDIDRTNNELFFALNLFIDDDNDGLARAWEIANGLSDSNGSDAGADWDGDGFTNRQEFLAGTNPNDSNSFLKVGQFNVVQNGNGTSLTATISWPSVAGRLYAIERSFDLVTWQVVADNIESTPPLNSVTNAATPPGGRVFYRVIAK